MIHQNWVFVNVLALSLLTCVIISCRRPIDTYFTPEYITVQSSDLENWADISDQISFPEGTRHGSVFKVKQSVLEKLKTVFPGGP